MNIHKIEERISSLTNLLLRGVFSKSWHYIYEYYLNDVLEG